MAAPGVAPFGALLRRFRLAASLSQEALAERARLSSAAIAALERGRRTAPRPDTVALLADALALSATDRARFVGAAMPAQQAASAPLASPIPDAPAYHGRALPVPPTPLIGREDEEARLGQALRQAGGGSGARLFTLIGPGGVGKTRLALEVAAAWQETFSDGVYWVDLSDLREPVLVAAAVAQALEAHPSGSQSARDLLITRLRPRHSLLILDNFEQVLDAAPLLSDLLAQCPRLVLLTTSRVALRVRGEQRFQVPPLPLPTRDQRVLPEALAGFAAIRLFVSRARAVQPTFTLRADQADTVAEICRRVDGLPLAIELAAARIALLPPPALLARLESSLALLRGGARDLPGRQQTMRATIDWSHDLLSTGEQVLFRRFAVFHGGCAIEAAEAVCATSDGVEVLEGVGSLVEKSLLVRHDEQGTPRLLMLETLHEYAREQLTAHGEREAARQAHAVYYLARAEADWTANFDDRHAWLARWKREHDNVRAALGWAREHGEAELGLRLACAVWRLWIVHGHLTEGSAWMDDLLRLPGPVPAATRVAALRCAGALATQMGDSVRGAAWCLECLALCRALNDRRHMADVLNTLGNILRGQGDFARAVEHYDQSLALYRELGDRVGIAAVLNNRGTVARYQGDLELAMTLYTESQVLRREERDTWGMAYVLHNLSVVAWRQGDPARARAQGEESLSLRRELGDRQGMADCLILLAFVAREEGELDRAAVCLREAADLSQRIDARQGRALALIGLADLAAEQGSPHRAARLLGMAAVTREPSQSGPPPEDDRYEQQMARIRATLGEAAFTAAWISGHDLPTDLALAEALDPRAT